MLQQHLNEQLKGICLAGESLSRVTNRTENERHMRGAGTYPCPGLLSLPQTEVYAYLHDISSLHLHRHFQALDRLWGL